MQLFLSLPTGQTRSVTVSSKSSSISSLLSELSISDDVSIVFSGKPLQLSKSISDYPEISNDSRPTHTSRQNTRVGLWTLPQ